MEKSYTLDREIEKTIKEIEHPRSTTIQINELWKRLKGLLVEKARDKELDM